MRSRACWLSARVGPVRVAKFEHPLQYFPNGRKWIQLSALDLVEQPPQLRVVGDRALEVRLRAPGSDREHLAGQVLPPALVEQPIGLEVLSVLLDLRPQSLDVLASHRL